MSENIMDDVEIKQMNDYALSKWVNEQQVLNSATQYNTKSVRVRLFNTYGPGEYYSPYRSVICLFIYKALHNITYNVYKGHKRTSTYITDCAKTLSNISENFIPGMVYNIGGTDYHDIETASSLILQATGKSENDLVRYKDSEILTTKHKIVDSTAAIRDLKHNSSVDLHEGIKMTVDWAKKIYKI